MASHVGVLDEGRLVQFGTPREIYENPQTAYVAARLGQPRINLLPVGVLDEGAAPPGAQLIGLRPENILQGKGLEATVVRVEHLGDQTRLHLKVADHDVITLTDPHTVLSPGEAIQIAPENPVYFDAQGVRIS